MRSPKLRWATLFMVSALIGGLVLDLLVSRAQSSSELPLTLLIFPGTEFTAVESQIKLAQLGVDLELHCPDFSVPFIEALGSQCALSFPFQELVFRAEEQETDLVLFGVFTSEDLQELKSLVSFWDLSSGVVGVGNMHKIHVATLPETGIRSLADLDDNQHSDKTSTGREESTHEAHAHDVFQAEELYNALNRHQHQEIAMQPELLLQGELDAFFETNKVPSPHVNKVAVRNNLVLIAIPPETVERMNALKEEGEAPYIPTEIDLAQYEEGSDESIETAGVTEVVAATTRLSDELVEAITRVLLEEPFVTPRDLERALLWLKEQGITLHPVSGPIIENFLNLATPPP